MENYNVAYCGLYCGACKSLKKGKCPVVMEMKSNISKK